MAVRTIQTVLQGQEGLYDRFSTGQGFTGADRVQVTEIINQALAHEGEGNPLFARVQLLQAVEELEGYADLPGENAAEKMQGLQERSGFLRAVEQLEGYADLPGENAAEKMQGLQERSGFLRAVEQLEGYADLPGANAAEKVAGLQERSGFLRAVEELEGYGDLPGANAAEKMQGLQERSGFLRAVEELEGYGDLPGANAAEKMQGLQERSGFLRAVEQLEGYADLPGANAAEKMQGLQARAEILRQIEALPGFGVLAGVDAVARVRGLQQRVVDLEALGGGAHMPAIQNTMAQAIEVINTLMTMFPGSFEGLGQRVQDAEEATFNTPEFGALAGIRAVAAQGANNKERALYILAQTGALQTYMGTRHIVVERLPFGEVNTEEDLVRQVDALREQLRVANNALHDIEGADLGEKVVELRRQRDGDQTFFGGVTAAFWAVVETVMSVVRFIFITMPTYALDSLRSLGGVFSRS